MNVVNRFFIVAVAVAIFIGFTIASSASPPEKLPIGSLQKVMHWAITNRTCFASVGIEYYPNPTKRTYRPNLAYAIKFASYSDFQRYFVSEYNKLIAKYRNEIVTPTVNVSVYIRYPQPGSVDVTGLIIQLKNVGPINTTVDEQLTNAQPSWVSPSVVVPNLGSTPQVVVNSSPVIPYSYTNLVSLQGWYCLGTNKVRISITADGITKTYTQTGDVLERPRMSLRNKRIEISMTPGSDTILQSSTDGQNWVDETVFNWSSTSNTITIPISLSRPHLFYRCISE